MKDRMIRLVSPILLMSVVVLSNACTEDDVTSGSEDGGAGGASGAEAGSSGGGGSAETDAGIPDVTEDPGCDLTGKWISVRRMITYTLEEAVVQSGHNFGYWEIEQSGTEAEVSRGLRCGMIIKDRSEPSYSTVGASEALWNGITRHSRNDGRRVIAGATEAGDCYISFERRHVVRGATVPYFEDPERPLSEAMERAEGDRPGWEDWDEDGHPGVTFVISGVANGNLYVAQRDWAEWDGEIPREAERFRLEVIWNTEQLVIETDPPDFPVPDAWASTKPGENYTWFHRVDDSIVGDTDLETCANTRAQLETLLPEGFE